MRRGVSTSAAGCARASSTSPSTCRPSARRREEQALFAEGLAALAARADVLRLMHYQPAHVLDEHRAAGCSWLARCGVRVAPSRVVLTAGSQHALFVALATLARPGDEILTEALTYPGLKSAAELLHLRLRGVSLDGEGVMPEASTRPPPAARASPTSCPRSTTRRRRRCRCGAGGGSPRSSAATA